jgi:hypothetical protein
MKAVNYPITKRVSQVAYPKTVKISQQLPKAKIEENLPFRVKFFQGRFSSFSENNPAPIGIAVIGINNYIL